MTLSVCAPLTGGSPAGFCFQRIKENSYRCPLLPSPTSLRQLPFVSKRDINLLYQLSVITLNHGGYVISCCVQDCVVLLAPFHNNPNPVESRLILTCRGTAWCGMSILNSSSTVPLVLWAPRGQGSVYSSTFEPIDLTPDDIMHPAGVPAKS
jgi:hypothetical protein